MRPTLHPSVMVSAILASSVTCSLAGPTSPCIKTRISHNGGTYASVLVFQDPTSSSSAGFARSQDGRPIYTSPTYSTVSSDAKVIIEFRRDKSAIRQNVEVILGATIELDLPKGDYELSVTLPRDTYLKMRDVSKKLGGRGHFFISQQVQVLPASDKRLVRQFLVIAVR